MKVRIFLIIVFTSISIYSCTEKKSNHRIKEGLIKYDIEYLDDSLQNFMSTFLPKKMTIKFKDNNTINKIESLSGIVSFSHIQNTKKGESITLVKIFNNKYKYIEKIGEPSIFYKNLPNINISRTGETKNIAGYDCAKAQITCSDTLIKPFNVYYTNNIEISNANAHTPFRNIDGVLLQFEIKLYGIRMKLTASDILETKVSKENFHITNEYKQINKKTMKEIIKLLK